MLAVGTEAPSFSLTGYHDGAVEEFAIEDYVGDDVVVLAFYPVDFAPWSVDGASSLRDLEVLSLMDDVTILGISADSVYSHRAFAEANAIEYPLLTDSVGAVAAEYGVRHAELDGHRNVPKRAAFVVDDRGRIAHAWSTDDPGVGPDVATLRDAVASVQDDRIAVERYARGHEHWQYGRSEFENALGAYDREQWAVAAAAFGEAVPYFEAAGEAFASAAGFAESASVRRAAERARDASADFENAATWYGSAADHHADGGADIAAEYHADAERHHRSARTVGELPGPDDLDAG